MDLKEIKQIVDLMKRSSLTEFEIEEEGLKLRICRSSGETPVVMATPTAPPFPVAAAPAMAAPAAVVPEAVDPGKSINSPMVGTYYAAPSPESPSFVKVGDAVTPDTVVCIIEAMKVMNEIKAETNGVISEMLVNNGDSVEFGQQLFKLK